MFVDLVAGFLVGFSFILVIGPQNAYVLRCGIKRNYILPVCLACSISDGLLIAIGVSGGSKIVETMPLLKNFLRFGGALFLFYYGAKALFSAWKGGGTLTPKGESYNFLNTILTCLALTWLNPHVYIDTILLLGSLAHQFGSPLSFSVGAILASFVFFFSLGYFAVLLSPLFLKPQVWQILDVVIAIIMWTTCYHLIVKQ